MKEYLWLKYVVMGMFATSLYLLLFDSKSSTPSPYARVESPVSSAPSTGHTTVATGRLRIEQIEKALKTSKTAEDLERALNSSDIRGDDMDLTGDGKPDYIHVAELTSPAGFLLSLQSPNGKTEELARVAFTPKENGSATVQYQGNAPYFAGPTTHTSMWPSLTSGLILGYLWGSHRPYSSPYAYGSYPSHFSTARNSTPAPSARYGTPAPLSRPQATPYKAPMQQPLRSQRGFQSKPSFGGSRGGGFGRRR